METHFYKTVIDVNMAIYFHSDINNTKIGNTMKKILVTLIVMSCF